MLELPNFEKDLSFDLFEFACFLKKHEKRKDLNSPYCLNHCLREGSRVSLIKKKGFIVGFVLYSVLFSKKSFIENAEDENFDEDDTHEVYLNGDDIAFVTLEYIFILPKHRGKGYVSKRIEMISISLQHKLFGLLKEIYVSSEPINEKGNELSNTLLSSIKYLFNFDDEDNMDDEDSPDFELTIVHNDIDYFFEV
jgi:hypothetical protein